MDNYIVLNTNVPSQPTAASLSSVDFDDIVVDYCEFEENYEESEAISRIPADSPARKDSNMSTKKDSKEVSKKGSKKVSKKDVEQAPVKEVSAMSDLEIVEMFFPGKLALFHKYNVKYAELGEASNGDFDIFNKSIEVAGLSDQVREYEDLMYDVSEKRKQVEHKSKLSDGYFWTVSEGKNKDTVFIDRRKLRDFVVNELGFGWYAPNVAATSEKKGRIFVRVVGNIVHEVGEPEKIYGAIKDENHIPSSVIEMLAMPSKAYLSKAFFVSLPNIEKDFIKSTKSISRFYYRNGVVEVSKDDIKLIPYEEIEGVVWASQIVQRDIEITNEATGLFAKFMENTCTDKETKALEVPRKECLDTAMGYLLSGY